ncbi:MAG: FAD-binding oxidoreductase [Fuerstiella sp.]
MASLHPESAEDVSTAIQQAISEHKQISLCCAKNDSATAIHLHLDRLNQVIDYPFDDMTITVQAGITCTELNQVLAAHNQQLPIDIHQTTTTVGEVVASNLFGPRVCGYGTIRDYLIGIQAVDGAGRIFKAGGKVVKNVAGYDLCRLMIGSHGRLGTITECTFKLNPLPASASAIRIGFQSQIELTAALQALNSSNARPTFVDLHWSASGKEYAELVVGIEGSASSCRWQLDQIQQECKVPAIESFSSRQVADYLSHPDHFWTTSQQRLKTRRSHIVAIADHFIQQQLPFHGYAADGILHTSVDPQLRSILMKAVPTADVQFCDRNPAFTAQQHPLNERLLHTFDPHGIFKQVPES